MKEHVEKLVKEGTVDAVLGQKLVGGYPHPFLFTRENIDEVKTQIVAGMRYPIVKILLELARSRPDGRFGVVVRGCEERALTEIFKHNQIEPERVTILGYACSQRQAEECECPEPYPTEVLAGDKVNPVTESKRVDEVEAMPLDARMEFWISHFNRCIRCYACRDICPVCFCKVCTLEEPELIATDILPPDSTFHMVRAVHMAGRCIDCGLCEEICPSHIPLRTLYKKVGAIVEDLFDYRTGLADGKSPFNMLGDKVELHPRPL